MADTKFKELVISRACKECIHFISKKCDGKAQSKKQATYFGTHVDRVRRSGLNFCTRYEFDERLYTFDDGSRFGGSDTIKTIRKRQATKDKETSEQNHSDTVNISETLSSADLENLI